MLLINTKHIRTDPLMKSNNRSKLQMLHSIYVKYPDTCVLVRQHYHARIDSRSAYTLAHIDMVVPVCRHELMAYRHYVLQIDH